MAVALVTGVTGQDGGYLAEALLARGDTVHALVRPGRADAVPAGVTAHEGGLDDPLAWRRALDASGPDLVFHLAAQSSVARSWADPLETHRVNATGTVALLDALVRWTVAHGTDPAVVHASSAEVFGAAPAPQDERTPLRPVSPYGASKAAAQHAVAVGRDRGLRASNAVLFSHESPRRPDTFVTRKITRAAARMAAGDGAVLRLGDLDVRRDWGWAPDVVAALIAVADSAEPDDYVVATGESHSVREFVAVAFAEVGLDPAGRVEVDPELLRATDAPEQRGDASRLRDRLGWAPTVPFGQVVARMVAADVAAL